MRLKDYIIVTAWSMLFIAALFCVANMQAAELTDADKLTITAKQLAIARAELAKQQAETAWKAADEASKKLTGEMAALIVEVEKRCGGKLAETDAGLVCQVPEGEKK